MPPMAGQTFRSRRKTVFVELAVLLGRNDRYFVIELSILVNSNAALAIRKSVSV